MASGRPDRLGVIIGSVLTRDGRSVRTYDRGPAGSHDHVPVLWQHGTRNTGAPPEPWAGVPGVRWVGFDRPGYGGSTARPGRRVADVVTDVTEVADALGISRFATVGFSGGGPYALACAAGLGDRVSAVITVAGLAPPLPGARPAPPARTGFDPDRYTDDDHDALLGDWSWLLEVSAGDAAGVAEDVAANGQDWGVDLGRIRCPVTIVHGDADRVVPVKHADRLLRALPHARAMIIERAGHLSVLRSIRPILDRLRGPG